MYLINMFVLFTKNLHFIVGFNVLIKCFFFVHCLSFVTKSFIHSITRSMECIHSIVLATECTHSMANHSIYPFNDLAIEWPHSRVRATECTYSAVMYM